MTDTGKRFDIVAMLADSSAQTAAQSWYQHPNDLTSLFPGMTQYSNVTVIRRWLFPKAFQKLGGIVGKALLHKHLIES